MTRKEYKKKCKEEKAISYKLMLIGGIVALIGLVIVLFSAFVLSEVTLQIIGYAIGGVVAFGGVVLDLIGELILAKNYVDYKD